MGVCDLITPAIRPCQAQFHFPCKLLPTSWCCINTRTGVVALKGRLIRQSSFAIPLTSRWLPRSVHFYNQARPTCHVRDLPCHVRDLPCHAQVELCTPKRAAGAGFGERERQPESGIVPFGGAVIFYVRKTDSGSTNTGRPAAHPPPAALCCSWPLAPSASQQLR